MTKFRSIIWLLFSLPAFALAAPADLEPLPEPPPPPAGYEPDPSTEPEVTIIKRGEDTVQEYRINGELYEMKVTPAHGVPYYLVRQARGGEWTKMDGPGEHLSVPQWVLFKF